MIYTFRMSDAWGDDYTIEITAASRGEAEHIANTIDDDAVVKRLMSVRQGEPHDPT